MSHPKLAILTDPQSVDQSRTAHFMQSRCRVCTRMETLVQEIDQLRLVAERGPVEVDSATDLGLPSFPGIDQATDAASACPSMPSFDSLPTLDEESLATSRSPKVSIGSTQCPSTPSFDEVQMSRVSISSSQEATGTNSQPADTANVPGLQQKADDLERESGIYDLHNDLHKELGLIMDQIATLPGTEAKIQLSRANELRLKLAGIANRESTVSLVELESHIKELSDQVADMKKLTEICAFHNDLQSWRQDTLPQLIVLLQKHGKRDALALAQDLHEMLCDTKPTANHIMTYLKSTHIPFQLLDQPFQVFEKYFFVTANQLFLILGYLADLQDELVIKDLEKDMDSLLRNCEQQAETEERARIRYTNARFFRNAHHDAEKLQRAKAWLSQNWIICKERLVNLADKLLLHKFKLAALQLIQSIDVTNASLDQLSGSDKILESLRTHIQCAQHYASSLFHYLTPASKDNALAFAFNDILRDLGEYRALIALLAAKHVRQYGIELTHEALRVDPDSDIGQRWFQEPTSIETEDLAFLEAMAVNIDHKLLKLQGVSNPLIQEEQVVECDVESSTEQTQSQQVELQHSESASSTSVRVDPSARSSPLSMDLLREKHQKALKILMTRRRITAAAHKLQSLVSKQCKAAFLAFQLARGAPDIEIAPALLGRLTPSCADGVRALFRRSPSKDKPQDHGSMHESSTASGSTPSGIELAPGQLNLGDHPDLETVPDSKEKYLKWKSIARRLVRQSDTTDTVARSPWRHLVKALRRKDSRDHIEVDPSTLMIQDGQAAEELPAPETIVALTQDLCMYQYMCPLIPILGPKKLPLPLYLIEAEYNSCAHSYAHLYMSHLSQGSEPFSNPLSFMFYTFEPTPTYRPGH